MKRTSLILLLVVMVFTLTSCWVKKEELDVAIDARFDTLMAGAVRQMNSDYAQKSKAFEEVSAYVLASADESKAVAQQATQDAAAFIHRYTDQINQHIADCDTNIPKRIEAEVSDYLTEISVNSAETLLKLYNSYYESIIDVLAAYAIESASEQRAGEIKAVYDDYVSLKKDFYGYLDDGSTLDTIIAGNDAVKVETVNTLIAQVTEETIQSTNILSRIASVDRSLTRNQRTLLSKQTAAELDALVTVWNTIKGIDDLASKSNSDYTLFTAIQTNYAKLDDAHRAMVYNFDLEQLYAKYFFLDFTSVKGGLSVKARAGYEDKLVGDIVVPATYDGQKVVEIPEKAFQNCSKITSLVIPDTVNTIGSSAFNGCGGLTSISLPFVGKYRSGGNYAEALFGYVFGPNAYHGGTKVDFGSFVDTNLNSSYNKVNHPYYVPTKLSTVTITSASRLTYHAFYNCWMIQELNLNREIILMGDGCFAHCTGIERIDLPSVEAIAHNAFEGCSSLESFTINENVYSIGNYAFKGCTNLMRMNSEVDHEFAIPPYVTFVGHEAFSGCANIHTLTIPHIGKERNGGNYAEALFGYIFGPTAYYGGTKVDFGSFVDTNLNSSYNKVNHLYYVPNQLKSVTVTHDSRVSYHAFYNCRMISTLRINKEASVNVGSEAFFGSASPTYF